MYCKNCYKDIPVGESSLNALPIWYSVWKDEKSERKLSKYRQLGINEKTATRI